MPSPPAVRVPPGLVKDAVLSDDDLYRYWLLRQWDPSKPTVGVVMLNPSTADHRKDDATITTLLAMTRHWGCGRLEVVNLFGYRSPSPDDLRKAYDEGLDPTGPENGLYVHSLLADAKVQEVVVAWGNHHARWAQFQVAARTVAVMAERLKRQLWCLQVLKDGWPRHPLYWKQACQLEPWTVPERT